MFSDLSLKPNVKEREREREINEDEEKNNKNGKRRDTCKQTEKQRGESVKNHTLRKK